MSCSTPSASYEGTINQMKPPAYTPYIVSLIHSQVRWKSSKAKRQPQRLCVFRQIERNELLVFTLAFWNKTRKCCPKNPQITHKSTLNGRFDSRFTDDERRWQISHIRVSWVSHTKSLLSIPVCFQLFDLDKVCRCAFWLEINVWINFSVAPQHVTLITHTHSLCSAIDECLANVSVT